MAYQSFVRVSCQNASGESSIGSINIHNVTVTSFISHCRDTNGFWNEFFLWSSIGI